MVFRHPSIQPLPPFTSLLVNMEVQSRPRARFPAGAGGAGPSGTHYALYRPQGSDGGMGRSQIEHLRFRMLWVHSLRSSPSLRSTSESMGSHGKPHMGWHQRAPQRSSGPVAARVLGRCTASSAQSCTNCWKECQPQ